MAENGSVSMDRRKQIHDFAMNTRCIQTLRLKDMR